MPVTTKDLLTSMSAIDINPSLLLSFYETKVREAETLLNEYKTKVSFLKRKITNNNVVEITDFNMKLTSIKWREEIRNCITTTQPLQFYLANSNQIARCIAYNQGLEIINRDVRSKISSTLSLMFREGEIGRTGGENGKDFLYGIEKFFEQDMITLKKEYRNRLSELEQYK